MHELYYLYDGITRDPKGYLFNFVFWTLLLILLVTLRWLWSKFEGRRDKRNLKD